jgi:hypothetical protein
VKGFRPGPADFKEELMFEDWPEDEWDDEPGDEDAEWNPSVVDSDNRVRVMVEKCDTCIFRPGNLMTLNPGRVADMTRSTDLNDTNVTCHKTLGTPLGAFCAGSVARQPGQLVRIAERLNGIVKVDAKEYEED